jgi:hypothetical protein
MRLALGRGAALCATQPTPALAQRLLDGRLLERGHLEPQPAHVAGRSPEHRRHRPATRGQRSRLSGDPARIASPRSRWGPTPLAEQTALLRSCFWGAPALDRSRTRSVRGASHGNVVDRALRLGIVGVVFALVLVPIGYAAPPGAPLVPDRRMKTPASRSSASSRYRLGRRVVAQ